MRRRTLLKALPAALVRPAAMLAPFATRVSDCDSLVRAVAAGEPFVLAVRTIVVPCTIALRGGFGS